MKNESKKKILVSSFEDYILVYEDRRATAVDELMVSIQPPTTTNEENERTNLALQKQKDRHRLYKRRFLSNLSRIGLIMETVNTMISSSIESFLLSTNLGC